MKLKQRIACLALVLALLCPLAASCTTAETPSPTLQTETEEKAETKEDQKEKETKISYPCQRDQVSRTTATFVFCLPPTYGVL